MNGKQTGPARLGLLGVLGPLKVTRISTSASFQNQFRGSRKAGFIPARPKGLGCVPRKRCRGACMAAGRLKGAKATAGPLTRPCLPPSLPPILARKNPFKASPFPGGEIRRATTQGEPRRLQGLSLALLQLTNAGEPAASLMHANMVAANAALLGEQGGPRELCSS